MTFVKKDWANDAAGNTPITDTELERIEQGIADLHDPYIAKGMTIVGTGTGTFAGRALGTQGQILVVDTVEATGQKWQTMSWAATLANATTTTETVIATHSLGANELVAGSILNLRHLGLLSSTATMIYRIRMGPLGTTADPVVVTFQTSAAGVANQQPEVDAIIHVATAGSGGTVFGGGQVRYSNAAGTSLVLGPVPAAAATAALNTTVAQKLLLTMQMSAANTYTSRSSVLNRLV